MKKEIYINGSVNEVRIAITENGKLAEYFIEQPEKARSIGNIYYGKVNNIVNNISAAFIDIGSNQDAFLPFSEIEEGFESLLTDDDDFGLDGDNSEEVKKEAEPLEIDYEEFSDDSDDSKSATMAESANDGNETLIEESTQEESKDAKKTDKTKKGRNPRQSKRPVKKEIELKEKQNIIVQVVREAYAQKGAKVTTRIALPGRHVVFLPFDNILGISKKIRSGQERRRLRTLAKQVLPKGSGCIIRTAAEEKSEIELKRDWEDLIEKWKEIEYKIKANDPPMLLYQDMQLAASVIRDLFTKDVTKVYIDSRKLHKEIASYLQWASPQLFEKIELYEGQKPIFDNFGIEKAIENSYRRKIDLPAGGSIVIDQTEAMFVIDVNTSKSSEKMQEQNYLKTNLEAAIEAARQIRIRDMSGIILIDFIDMHTEASRKKLFSVMRNEIRKDRAKTMIYPLTMLGLMQITRQRINQNISEKVTEKCPTCNGRGRIASKAVLINSMDRWLKNFRNDSSEFRLRLQVHPHIADYITDGTLSKISKLMIKYFVKINLEQTELVQIDQFRFISVKKSKDITSEYL